MKVGILFLSLAASLSIFATDVKIIYIYNLQDDELMHFIISVDEDDKITSIGQVYYKKGAKTPYLTEKFTVDEVMTKGAVLSEDSGRKVVIMRSLDANEYTGGRLILDYMTDGTWNDRKNRKERIIELVKNARTDEFEVFMDNKKVTEMCFYTNKNFVGIDIGVKKIESGKCPK